MFASADIIELIILIIVASFGILLFKGLKNGIATIIIIFSAMAAYFITLKYWGEEGKKYLAIVLCAIAVVVTCVRIIKGKGI